MSLHLAKPYLNLTDFKKCKFCWYASQAPHISTHVGCKLHQTMVKNEHHCSQWLEPSGEIKVDANDRGYEGPRNKVIR